MKKHGITSFKRGMQVRYNGDRWLTVIHVEPDGEARIAGQKCGLDTSVIGQCELKTDGIWEGQVRRRRHGDCLPGTTTVRCLSADEVAYDWQYDDGWQGQGKLSKKRFIVSYPTVVFPEPKPTLKSVAEAVYDRLYKITLTREEFVLELMVQLKRANCVIQNT